MARAEVLQGKELSLQQPRSTSTRPCSWCASSARPAVGDHQAHQPVRRRRERRRRGGGLPDGARGRSGVGVRRHRRRATASSTTISARELSETFLECVIAPGFTDGALRGAGDEEEPAPARPIGRRRTGAPAGSCAAVNGGLLVQTRDDRTSSAAEAEVASKRAPTADELRALDFAWRVCKHVKSNAIVFARCRRRRRAHRRRRRRADVARRLGADRALEGAVAHAGLGAAPPTPSSPSATASTQPPRRARRRSSSRAARCATRRSSPPPTSTAWRWCSPAMRHFRH